MFRTLLALALPAALLAGGPAAGNGRHMGRNAAPSSRAHLMARLHMLRTQRIQAFLGVPDSLAKAIADRWSQLDLDAHIRRQGMRMARQRVQDILSGPGTEEEKNLRIGPALTQFSLLHRQHVEAKQRFEEDLQRTLTPIQQGRFLLLMEDFQRNFAEVMGERPRE